MDGFELIFIWLTVEEAFKVTKGDYQFEKLRFVKPEAFQFRRSKYVFLFGKFC